MNGARWIETSAVYNNATRGGGGGSEDVLSCVSGIVSILMLIYTFVMYWNYKHLHVAANHVFVFGVLGFDFVNACTTVGCIFARRYESDLTSRQACVACGFVIQIYSFAEPCFMVIFWLLTLTLMTGEARVPTLANGRGLTVTSAVVVGVAVFSSILAAGLSYFDTGTQRAWCWVDTTRFTWFCVVFCWMWIFIACVMMLVSLAVGIFRSHLNRSQKGLLWRRGTLAGLWLFINVVDVLARCYPNAALLNAQAFLDPASGFVNAASFLFSERMIMLNPCGMSAGDEPPLGFTAVLRLNPMTEREDLLSPLPPDASRYSWRGH